MDATDKALLDMCLQNYNFIFIYIYILPKAIYFLSTLVSNQLYIQTIHANKQQNVYPNFVMLEWAQRTFKAIAKFIKPQKLLTLSSKFVCKTDNVQALWAINTFRFVTSSAFNTFMKAIRNPYLLFFGKII